MLAVKAAREKAVAMAAELGQKIGRPRSIYEGGATVQTAARNAYTQNAMQSSGGSDGGGEGFSAGQISVTASVTVHFELAD
jgi:uncharacterized protein YggE